MTVTGAELNTFLPVKVDGQFGWVASEWVARGAISLEQTATPSHSGTATAIGAVDLLSAPADDGAMMATIPSVAVVTLTGEAQDGFLGVLYEGQEGWADAAYLEVAEVAPGAVLMQPADVAAVPAGDATVGAEATTTNLVNLRSQPDATAPVLSVIAAGSPVTLTGSQANGYANVRVAGQAGWIDARYLQ